MSFSGQWTLVVEEAVLSDLSSSLHAQGLCVRRFDVQSADVVVHIQLRRSTENLVEIEIADTLTDKRVARDIALQNPADPSSGLVLAVAADELLRAAWAELALPSARPVPTPPPAAQPPARAEPQAISPPPGAQARGPTTHTLEGRAVVDVFVQSSTFLGGDVVYRVERRAPVQWSLFAGPRFALQKQVADRGEVSAQAFSFGTSAQVSITRGSSWEFGPMLTLQGVYAWYEGRPDPSSTGSEVLGLKYSGLAMTLRGGLGLQWRLTPGLALFACSELGAPLVSLAVSDGQDEVAGVQGLESSSSLGLGYGWSL
jgi:hypothetical protein